jgi:cytochrome c biogenesis protein CcmG, thiol:disulfide interchange protein DsbE
MMLRRILLPLVAILALLGLFYVGLGMDSRALPSPLVGKPAPAFQLESFFDPDVIITEADFIGETALVNVWASWCSTCLAEKPYLMELARQGIKIHSFNYRDTRENARRYLSVDMNPYDKIAFDPDGEAGMEWGVYATPETYLLDPQGTIRYKRIGPLNPKLIREEILPLIAKIEAENR